MRLPRLLALLWVSLLLAAHAEMAWQDTFRAKVWPNSTAACVSGEVEPRIAALRAANPSILYRWRTIAVNEYLPGEEYPSATM